MEVLWKYCGEIYFHANYWSGENVRCRPKVRTNGQIEGCGYFEELFWSGGGTGRLIPDE